MTESRGRARKRERKEDKMGSRRIGGGYLPSIYTREEEKRKKGGGSTLTGKVRTVAQTRGAQCLYYFVSVRLL